MHLGVVVARISQYVHHLAGRIFRRFGPFDDPYDHFLAVLRSVHRPQRHENVGRHRPRIDDDESVFFRNLDASYERTFALFERFYHLAFDASVAAAADNGHAHPVAVHGMVRVARFDDDILFAFGGVIDDDVGHSAGGHVHFAGFGRQLFAHEPVLSGAHFLEHAFGRHRAHQVVHHLAAVVALDADLFGCHFGVVNARGMVGESLEQHAFDLPHRHFGNIRAITVHGLRFAPGGLHGTVFLQSQLLFSLFNIYRFQLSASKIGKNTRYPAGVRSREDIRGLSCPA